MPELRIEIPNDYETVIEGVRYSNEFFRFFGEAASVGKLFKIVKREGETVTIEEVRTKQNA
jgi:hypothetical protein